MLLCTLGSSLLGNILAGNGVILTSKSKTGAVRAGESVVVRVDN